MLKHETLCGESSKRLAAPVTKAMKAAKCGWVYAEQVCGLLRITRTEILITQSCVADS
jgi:hypothetical protein